MRLHEAEDLWFSDLATWPSLSESTIIVVFDFLPKRLSFVINQKFYGSSVLNYGSRYWYLDLFWLEASFSSRLQIFRRFRRFPRTQPIRIIEELISKTGQNFKFFSHFVLSLTLFYRNYAFISLISSQFLFLLINRIHYNLRHNLFLTNMSFLDINISNL